MEGKEAPEIAILHEVNAAPATASWKNNANNEPSTVKITLPYGCSVEGLLTRGSSGTEMFVSNIEVNLALQKNGIGSRLLKCLAAEAKRHGATSLSGHVISEAAFKTRAKVFGAENLGLNNLTYEEALKTSQASGIVDYHVKVDLSKVDTEDWELPVIGQSK